MSSSASFKEGLRELGLYMDESGSKTDTKNKTNTSPVQTPNEEKNISQTNHDDDYNISDIIFSASQSDPHDLAQNQSINPQDKSLHNNQNNKEIDLDFHPEENTKNNKSEKKKMKPKSKKQPQKKPGRKPPIDFEAIFEGFNDNEQSNNKQINEEVTQKINQNQSTIQQNPSIQNNSNMSAFDMETRILDYFNTSLNSMISSFLSEFGLYFKKLDNTDKVIQSFASDIKRSIRQLIVLNDSYLIKQQSDFVEPYLISYKNVFEDIQTDINEPLQYQLNMIKEYRNLFKSKYEIINSNMRASIGQLKQELAELTVIQKSSLAKERTLKQKHSQIKQKLIDLECKEILQRGELQVILSKQEKYDDLYNRIDPNINTMNDIDRIAESFQDFVLEYRSSQSSIGISNKIKELMKRMSISVEEFQESCQMYHIKVNQSLNVTNCAQNQMNESIMAFNKQMQSQMSRTLIQPENHNRMTQTQMQSQMSRTLIQPENQNRMTQTQIESPKKQSTTINKKKNTNSKSKISKLNQTELKSHSRRKRHLDPEITYMEDLRHKSNRQHHSKPFTRERK